jgi:hypothetical protein
VLALVDTHPPGLTALDARAGDAAEHTRRVLAALPVDAPLLDVVDSVRPVLNVWWPDSPAAAHPVRAAVEVLRDVAMHRTALVAAVRLGAPGLTGPPRSGAHPLSTWTAASTTTAGPPSRSRTSVRHPADPPRP